VLAKAAAIALLFAVGCVEPAAEHRVRANAFLRAGDADAAVKETETGLSKKPGDAALLILRGKALFELDRLDDARASYTDALATPKAEDSSLADAHLGLAIIASRKKEWAVARTHFEELVKINDQDATSLLNVARTCLELGDLECAMAKGDAAVRLRGTDEGVLYTVGNIYLNAGKPEEATRAFQRICETIPGAASCPYGQALVAAHAGDKPKALEHLREAVKRKIPNPAQLGSDKGFASLKDDPEFQRLMAEASKP
jgi:tetratricopeptide (TPR) repeat protein